MTKDRRKDTVEKMLENVYSPLYEILRKAKFEDDERSKARSLPGFEWSIKDDELEGRSCPLNGPAGEQILLK